MKALKKELPNRVLHFFMQDVSACVDLDNSQQVILLPMLKAVPGAPNYVAGLINLAGKTVPVIDLSLRLNLHKQQVYTLETPVIIYQIHEKQIGFIVDKIDGIFEVQEDDFQFCDEFSSPNSPYVATLLIGTQLSLLIDVDHIVQKDNEKWLT